MGRVTYDPDAIIPSGRYKGQRLGDLTLGKAIKLQAEVADPTHRWYKLAQLQKLERMRKRLHELREMMDAEWDLLHGKREQG